MKKVILVLSAILLNIATLTAQFHIEKSVPFDEPDYGWNKLLQMKNGNTLFFHSTKKDGIEVTVYDKQRKEIASKTLESNLWDVSKMRQSTIVGLYEINNEPVIFIVQGDDRKPTLYRMRINPNTGAIVKEDKLGNLPKMGMKEGYAIAFASADISNIIVEKDPYSDCYAVIYFDAFAQELGQRIKVVHYDGTHKVLNTVFYNSPGKFKYLRYIGSVVDSSKRVFVTTYGYNGKKDEEDATSRIVVSKINVGDTKFFHTMLDISGDFNDTKSVMLYNKNTNKLQLLTLSYSKPRFPLFMSVDNYNTYSKRTTDYYTYLSYIDPETLKLTTAKPIEGNKIDAYGKKNIDKDYEFDGVPQNMVLNKDNTTTVLLEEITNETRRYTSMEGGRPSMTGAGTTVSSTKLGPIGISELSDTGAELNGYAINKKQNAAGELSALYLYSRSKGHFTYPPSLTHKSNNNEFLSYDYINADKGRYVIFNDLPGNADKDEDEQKRKTVTSVSSTNTMCYKLNDPKMDKFYLFGEPDGKKAATYCYIESSDYNKNINTYATMIVERDGRDEQARIAWITFE